MAPTHDPIVRLVNFLSQLPGIGEKTATRLAFHIIRSPEEFARGLAGALVDVKEHVGFCSICCNLTQDDPCRICTAGGRERHVVCVVEGTPDLMAIERTGEFQGMYHVLHGALRPLEGVGPDDIRVKELVQRLAATSGDEETRVTEVIVATNPNTDGETTALYIAKLLRPFDVKVTRIASGVPIGGDLEYTDRVTLSRALAGRREI
ncbi:MAG: recombination protein RecR [Myxococcales bacterium]|nr:recombination protein RecR [Myxococcales bacterium]